MLLSDHPAKEHHFSQKHQWSHLGLKAACNSLHISSAYSKRGQQRELNQGFGKCYMPQTSLTNSCNSLKKLYIFPSFYLRCMNLIGGDRHFAASKEQDFIKTASHLENASSAPALWSTWQPVIAVSWSVPTPRYQFFTCWCRTRARVKKEIKKSAAEQRCHWSDSCLRGGESTRCSESAALIPLFRSWSPRAG